MAIKRSTPKKQTTPGLDNSNCSSLYGVFEIGLVGFIWLYSLCLPSTHAINFILLGSERP